PNAGTRMVKEVMNEVKEKYKWIDLLKPETQAAVGTLIVLDPSQAKKITDLVSIVGERISSGREVNQRLSAEGFQPREQVTDASAVTVRQLLGPNLREGIDAHPRQDFQDVDAMLALAEANLGKPNAQIVEPAAPLGTWQLIFD